MGEKHNPSTDEIMQCPACYCMVHPKKELRIVRGGMIMCFAVNDWNCPKCGEKRIWEPNE